MRTRFTKVLICVALAGGLIGSATAARAADDTAKFNGTWKANLPSNGQMVTIASVHTGSTYKNYAILPNGSLPVGDGTFAAADGKWTVTSPQGNDSGTYQFVDDKTAVCKDIAGQTVVWLRDTTPLPPIIVVPPPPGGGAPAGGNAPPSNEIPMTTLKGEAQAETVSPQMQADIRSKIQAGDYDGALVILNQEKAGASSDPFLCVTHAEVLLKMENYRQSRNEMTFFLQHTFNYAPAYVTHAEACAAMGDQRWADKDLLIAAALSRGTANDDWKAVQGYASMDPPGFAAAELPGQLDELVKMSGSQQPFESLVHQAMRIVKGEYNIRRVEADEYRDRKRQLVAAAIADPKHSQPAAEVASFLVEQASAIHGDGREGVGLVPYRLSDPDPERRLAIVWADVALKIDPRNAKAMACKAEAMIALGDDDPARELISQALAINPNEPELLRMFSQLSTRSASDNIDESERLATPTIWEDDQFVYMQRASDQDLAEASRLDAIANEQNANSATAMQTAIEKTKGTAAGFYYQAIQCVRSNDKVGGAAAMEQAVKLAPDNVEYRDLLAHFYGQMGWRSETVFFTQWSIADNLGETSAGKMFRLAYKQLRRTEYDAARQSLAKAMRIDPADPRGPACMGLLIAGENKDRAQIDQTIKWLMAACALEEANLRLWGARHPTPNIQYTSDQVGLEEGLAAATGEYLLKLNRPQDAAMLARHAIDDANRVAKDRWPYTVPSAMLPITSVQGTPAPHMDPVKAAPVHNTTIWVMNLHELAGNALKAAGQADKASSEFNAAKEIQKSMDDAQRNAGPPPVRR